MAEERVSFKRVMHNFYCILSRIQFTVQKLQQQNCDVYLAANESGAIDVILPFLKLKPKRPDWS